MMEDNFIYGCSYVGNGIFVGNIYYNGKNEFKYYLFDLNGEIVKSFPNHIFFNREKGASSVDGSLTPIRVDNQLYLKDFVNDTLYILEDFNLKPSYIFGMGKYSYPIENLEYRSKNPWSVKAFLFGAGLGIVGTPKFFFYKIDVPDLFSRPKAKTIYIFNEFRPNNSSVYGIYNIEQKKNILLDTDEHLQKGIINDINGGLPIIPRYYAGDGVVIDVWNAEDMKGVLTEEYFVSQTIKDQQAHQKLKEILKNLKEDDNPVVVVAKLK